MRRLKKVTWLLQQQRHVLLRKSTTLHYQCWQILYSQRCLVHVIMVAFHQLLLVCCRDGARRHLYTTDKCCVSPSTMGQCTCSGMLHQRQTQLVTSACQQLTICYLHITSLASVIVDSQFKAGKYTETYDNWFIKLQQFCCQQLTLSPYLLVEWTKKTNWIDTQQFIMCPN